MDVKVDGCFDGREREPLNQIPINRLISVLSQRNSCANRHFGGSPLVTILSYSQLEDS